MSDISVILSVLAAIVIIACVIVSIRLSKQTRKQKLPELGPIDELLENDEDEFEIEEIQSHTFKEPTLNSFGIDEPQQIDPVDDAETHEEIPQVAEPATVQSSSRNNTTAPEYEYTDLLVLNVMAQAGQYFSGYELLQSLLGSGLRFGDMSIFHCYDKPNGKGDILFSLASVTKPGTFDMNKMGSFKCSGLSLFMQLLSPKQNEESFERMLDCATYLAQELEGVVTDAKREDLSEDVIKHYRYCIQKHQESFLTEVS